MNRPLTIILNAAHDPKAWAALAIGAVWIAGSIMA